MRPNFTFTYGLHYTLLQTPYEVNGQQVAPTFNLYQWFQTRGQQAALGNSVQPYISFAPDGQARGGQPYWPMQKNNLGPAAGICLLPQCGTRLLAQAAGQQRQQRAARRLRHLLRPLRRKHRQFVQPIRLLRTHREHHQSDERPDPRYLATLHRHQQCAQPDRHAAAVDQLSGAGAYQSADQRIRHHAGHRQAT